MKHLILSTLMLFTLLIKGQNYITEYHQPAILGHQLILEQRYQEAQDYLEPCVKNFNPFPEEMYALALCYAANYRVEEAKELIYRSVWKGQAILPLFQDKDFWTQYVLEEEFEQIYDSCMVIQLKPVAKPAEMQEWVEKAYAPFRYRKVFKYTNGDTTFVMEPPYPSDSIKQHAISFFNTVNDKNYWNMQRLKGTRSFLYRLISYLPNENIEELLPIILEQVKQGNVSPTFYAMFHDYYQEAIGEPKLYYEILNKNNDLLKQQQTEQSCFEIGLGNRDVLYLKNRFYTY